jgi:lipid-binding SYLF domain-containing protein
MARFTTIFLVTAMLLLTATACTTAPTTDQGKTELDNKADASVAKALKTDSSLAKRLHDCAGYAVFPSVAKGALGVGGAYGKGVLYVGGAIVGYCDLTQATIGFQLGGQAYSEFVVFETPAKVDDFKQGHVTFDAQATAVALKAGAGANSDYTDGVAVFTTDEEGLMYEAAIGGQKFAYQPK